MFIRPMSIQIALILFLTGFFAIPLEAQEKPAPTLQGLVQAEQPIKEKRISVDFPGGTLNDFLQRIEEENGIVPNVILSEEARMLHLPRICLHDVRILDAMQGLENLYEIDGHRINVSSMKDVITVAAEPVQSRNRTPVQTLVYEVGSILSDACTVDDIVTAVLTAWEMFPEKSGAQIKFHEQTRLLIAVGDHTALTTVDNVLKELKGARQARAAAGRKAAEVTFASSAVKELEKQGKQVKEMREEMQALKRMIQAFREENALLKQQVKALLEKNKGRF